MPPISEFSCNHTTLQVLKTDRSAAFLQVTLDDLPAASSAELQALFSDEVLLHQEFALLGGRLVAFDLPIVRYTVDERLYAIVNIYRAHGCRVCDTQRWTVETGSLRPDHHHLGRRKRFVPHALMNAAKWRALEAVRHLSPEEIEKL